MLGKSSSGRASSEAAERGDLRGYGCPNPPIDVRLCQDEDVLLIAEVDLAGPSRRGRLTGWSRAPRVRCSVG